MKVWTGSLWLSPSFFFQFRKHSAFILNPPFPMFSGNATTGFEDEVKGRGRGSNSMFISTSSGDEKTHPGYV
jgi:hypothetical protein